ncbi:hypothetical protein MHB43_01255 [Paenibacillus sp. FSL H8-0317]|uniref:hypothetical protein n=1 Tax=Paenibacillus sp. FSL H8-0317 TaxID=2921385 RepID=UPI0032522935
MYNKQTWLDEIPDMTKPIYDASGKQKTDPQTGRPLFELVQVGTRITSSRLNTMEGGIEAAHTLVEQLAKELGGNFVVPIDGTMGLLCNAQGLKATWTTGIAYVSGRRYQVAAGEMPLNPTQGQYLYVDIDGVVKKTTSQTTAKKGLMIFYVATDTSGVISTTDHRVNISMEEILKKIKDINIEDAVTGGASGLMTGADAKFVRVDGETKTGSQEKANAVKDYVESRLDTSERSEVTLQPGLQVIQGKKNAPFNLSSIKGRTLINLLGRMGNFETLGTYTYSNGMTAVIDTTFHAGGTSSLRVVIPSNQSSGTVSIPNVKLLANKCYVLIGMIKNGNTDNGGQISFAGLADSALVTNTTKFNAIAVKYKPSADTTVSISMGVNGVPITTQYANFDELRLYELTQTEYDALDTVTPEQAATMYPYVDSLQPVKNPYAIRYGENLVPPFYEWEYGKIGTGRAELLSPYELYQYGKDLSSYVNNDVLIPVIPGITYTLSAEIDKNPTTITDALFFYWIGADGNRLPGEEPTTRKYKGTHVAPNDARQIQLYVDMDVTHTTEDKTQIIKNPMLNIGSTALPFKPREDPMLALQTELYADPLTGTNADEVFEKDGQYYKLAKWRGLALDGSLVYRSIQNKTGYKIVGSKMKEAAPAFNKLFVCKYNADLLTKASTMTGPDNAYFLTADLTDFNVSIANVDSGWGDSYTNLSADEIKAYFLGWKMFNWDGTTGGDHNGVSQFTGAAGSVKAWIKISEVGTAGASRTTVLPTTQAPNYTPYQLLYQLATPVVEPIMSEGQLTLIEGSNQIEVGTGVVVHEETKPVFSNLWSTYDINSINSSGLAANPLNYKAKKIRTVYKNNRPDAWSIIKDNLSYGYERAYFPAELFDSLSTYYVTYFMLDKTAIAPFVGSVAENEKTLLNDLNESVQQSVARVSETETSLNDVVRELLQQRNKRNIWGPIE